MKAKELIKLIKAGADVYVPVALGKDWQYSKLDKESLLDDLETDKSFSDVDCDVAAGDVWIRLPKE